MSEVQLIVCPKCGLMMSRAACHEVDDMTVFRCWECHHEFGIMLGKGELDLGVTK